VGEADPLHSNEVPSGHLQNQGEGSAAIPGPAPDLQFKEGWPRDDGLEASTSGDTAKQDSGPDDSFEAQMSEGPAHEDDGDGDSPHRVGTSSGDDCWEVREHDHEPATVLGLLQSLEEEALLPPPAEPLYKQLLDDLVDRILKVKEEYYSFETDEDGAIVPETSNPEDLDPESMSWRHAGEYALTDSWEKSVTCREYAYHHMKRWRQGANVAKSQVEETLRFSAHCLQPGEPNGPGNKNNRFPPSIYACQEILKVPRAKTYEFHVCTQGCVHWWGFMEHASSHVRNCGGCDLCRCPHCSSERYILTTDRKSVKDHAHIEPAQKCWFFFDVFHHMFLDEEWNTSYFTSTFHKLSPFHKTAENARLDKALQEQGFDPQQVRLLLPCYCILCITHHIHAYTVLCSPPACLENHRDKRAISSCRL
jgi:hypothetical protein